MICMDSHLNPAAFQSDVREKLHVADSLIPVCQQEVVGDASGSLFKVGNSLGKRFLAESFSDRNICGNADSALTVVDVVSEKAEPVRVHSHVGRETGVSVYQRLPAFSDVMGHEIQSSFGPFDYRLVVRLAADEISVRRRTVCGSESGAVIRAESYFFS